MPDPTSSLAIWRSCRRTSGLSSPLTIAKRTANTLANPTVLSRTAQDRDGKQQAYEAADATICHGWQRLRSDVRPTPAAAASIKRAPAPPRLRRRHGLASANSDSDLGITSVYLQGINSGEIIEAVHARRRHDYRQRLAAALIDCERGAFVRKEKQLRTAAILASMPAPLIEFQRRSRSRPAVCTECSESASGHGPLRRIRWQADTDNLRLGVHDRRSGPGDTASLPYFSVADLPTTIERVRELGGSVIHPGDRWAVCRDSEGGPFALAPRPDSGYTGRPPRSPR